MVTLDEIQNKFYTELQELYSKSEIQILLTEVLESAFIKSELLRTKLETQIEGQKLDKLNQSLVELKQGKPMQYVIGRTQFYGMSLMVDEATLIPRPETEELVDLIARTFESKDVGRALDIGTGSGCIALGLKKVFPNYNVLGIDVSEVALAVACENGFNNQLEVEFLLLDFLSDMSELEGGFDLIVSNPPYIKQSEAKTMSSQVLNFEPESALFVADDNPLIFYVKIAELIEAKLNTGGKVYLEINQSLGRETAEVFESRGFQADLLKDMSGNDRFLIVG